LLPLTLTAVPTWVPPEAQFVGGVVIGPKTLNVIVPVAVIAAPESVAVIDDAAIALPLASFAGAEMVVVALARTVVVWGLDGVAWALPALSVAIV
jgi:hypothetical protein